MKTYICEIDGKWYAFAADNNNVYSIGSDSNSAIAQGGYRWTGRLSRTGILYVASQSASRTAAYQKARRYGEYDGEINV